MTKRATFTQAELTRAMRAADALGKVALLTPAGIAFLPRDEAIKGLVEATENMLAAFYSNGNVTERHSRACTAGVTLSAALAAAKAVKHD